MTVNQGFSKKVINILDDFASFPSEGDSRSLYFDKETGEMYYWNGTEYVPMGGEPLNVLTTVQPTPTPTGNTTNKNSVFKDANGDTWIVDSNGDAIKAGATPIADVAYSKMLFVDPVNGNDTTGTGSDNKMFKTISKALTVANGSGYRIVLGAGTYTENITINHQNINIVTVAGTTGGNTFINGTVTFTHPASSSRIEGISMTNLVHSGAGDLYVKDCQVKTSFSKTSTGYLEVSDSDVVGVSITGTGQAVFIGGKQQVFTVNNAGAIVTVNDSINLAVATVTAGTLGVLDSIGFGATATGKGITSSAGTTVVISNSQFYGSTGLLTGLTLNGFYGIDDVQFDKVNSTLGTNLSTIGWFDKVGIINPATITTATKMLVRDTNGVVSEQLLPATTTVSVTQTNTTGKEIGSVTVNGVTTNLFETLTSLGALSYNGTTGVLSIPYTDENGTTTTRTVTIPVEIITTLTNTKVGNKIGTYTNESGVAVDINETITSIGTITFDSSTRILTIPYVDETGTTNEKTITIPTGLPSGGTDGQVLTVQKDGSYAWETLPTTSIPLHQRDVLIATANQTAFTLTDTPIGDTEKVIVTRNGVDISDAFTWVGTTGTYDPALNYNCVIDENDKLIFHYESL